MPVFPDGPVLVPSVQPDHDPGGPASDRAFADRASGVRARRLAVGVGVWLCMVALAIANAGVREVFVAPAVGDYSAHVISTASLLAALALLVALYFRRVAAHTTRELVALGVLWAGLTVAFELLFGHYVAGLSWADLLGQYDLAAGMVWVFVPLFLLVAPLAFGRWLVE